MEAHLEEGKMRDRKRDRNGGSEGEREVGRESKGEEGKENKTGRRNSK